MALWTPIECLCCVESVEETMHTDGAMKISEMRSTLIGFLFWYIFKSIDSGVALTMYECYECLSNIWMDAQSKWNIITYSSWTNNSVQSKPNLRNCIENNSAWHLKCKHAFAAMLRAMIILYAHEPQMRELRLLLHHTFFTRPNR